MKGQPKLPKHQFRITIDVELSPEMEKRIKQAMQKSVLAELASADLKGPHAINFLGDGGGTQGFEITAGGTKK